MKSIDRPGAPPFGTIVVLNGPTSAGKSTIARRLQQLLPEAWLHVQLDTFRAMEPADYFDRGQPDVSALRLAALCRAINATACQYAMHGQNVLLDHVLSDEAWIYLKQDLAQCRVLLVGVRCDGETLALRERTRGDRPIGLALSQVDRIHLDRHYDFDLDTTHRREEDCASELARWIVSNPPGRAWAACALQPREEAQA